MTNEQFLVFMLVMKNQLDGVIDELESNLPEEARVMIEPSALAQSIYGKDAASTAVYPVLDSLYAFRNSMSDALDILTKDK